VRSNYQGVVDRDESGIAYNAKTPVDRADRWYDPRFQAWWIHENPRFPWMARPLMGVRTTAWTFDGVAGGEIARTWDTSPFIASRTRTTSHTVSATLTVPRGFGYLPARWEGVRVAEGMYSTSTRLWRAKWPQLATLSVAAGDRFGGGLSSKPYGRIEASISGVRASRPDSANVTSLRVYAGGVTRDTPLQRAIFLSSRDPYQTLFNHFVRPEDGVLSPARANTVPLGGGGLRGFGQDLATRSVASINLEQGRRLVSVMSGSRPLAIWGTLFVDGGASRTDAIGDAGAGVMLRGWLFDRDVRVRVDLPVWVSTPYRTAAGRHDRRDAIAYDHVQLTLGSFW
jgi:hypothetical protein